MISADGGHYQQPTDPNGFLEASFRFFHLHTDNKCYTATLPP